MSQDLELRRLDLKSQLLSSDLLALQRKSLDLSSQLQTTKQYIEKASCSWGKLLRSTVQTYRQADQKIKSQLLSSGLKNLSAKKEVITQKKNEAQSLKDKITQLLVVSKQKNFQLQYCETKKNKKIEAKLTVNEQNSQDELAVLKYIKERNIADDTVLKSKNSYSLETSPVQAPEFRVCLDNIVLQPLTQRLECSAEGRQENSQHKWQAAREAQEVVENANQKVQVLISHSEQGCIVNLDYNVAPGRMIAFEGSQLNSSVGLSLTANNKSDRTALSKVQSELTSRVRKLGIGLTSFEVTEKNDS